MSISRKRRKGAEGRADRLRQHRVALEGLGHMIAATADRMQAEVRKACRELARAEAETGAKESAQDE